MKAKTRDKSPQMTEISPLVTHAKDELTRAGLFDKDSDYGGMLGKAALGLVKTFAAQGHSGMSAALVTELATRLFQYEPLTPLTGADDEWVDVSDVSGDPWWQNKRCHRVFKGADGKAYDVEGRIFRDPDGSTWVNGDSRVPVEFPYMPTQEYVDRQTEAAA
jgi:hypothetical protein